MLCSLALRMVNGIATAIIVHFFNWLALDGLKRTVFRFHSISHPLPRPPLFNQMC
ncbi:hypothetical protein SAMN05216299_10254 [Nitrosospira sp. Nsp14]|nr:hypothetical protein SAMN05216299_10254 [Nitrosospira sp. Nsp14]